MTTIIAEKPSTSLGLRLIANAMDGIPGLPPVYVTAAESAIGIQVIAQGPADDDRRCTAVDMLLAVLGASRTATFSEVPGNGQTYQGDARFGAYDVSVYAPHIGESS